MMPVSAVMEKVNETYLLSSSETEAALDDSLSEGCFFDMTGCSGWGNSARYERTSPHVEYKWG